MCTKLPSLESEISWRSALFTMNVSHHSHSFFVPLFRVVLRTVGLVWLLLTSMIVNSAPSLDHSALDDNNQSVKLSEFAGQVVYVDFWASWCAPCLKSFPWMQSMQRKYADQGLEIIAINLDEESSAATQFLSQFNVDFKVLFNPSGDIAAQFGLVGMPSSYLFNRDGVLVSSHVGFFNEELALLEQVILTQLAIEPVKEPKND